MKMRCRDATKQIGPYVDGELTAPRAEGLREHLDTCAACSRNYSLMRGLVRELSALPAIVPTPEESYRLMNRVRRETEAPAAAPRTFLRRGQLAAAALSLLVIATVAGLSLAVWSGRGPATVTDGTSLEAERSSGARDETGPTDQSTAGEQAETYVPIAVTARPALVTSGKEYTAAELEGFRNDVGTRLDFYSAYWYSASGGSAEPAALEELQAGLTSDLAEQAEAAGKDPVELERAVAAVLIQASDEPLLPCYAELVRMDGRDAWLVSVSGPEDYLLFPYPQRPPAFILASLGGTESLEISESLLRELAAMLAPSGNGSLTMAPAGTLKDHEEAARNDGISDDGAPSTPGTDQVETEPETDPQQAGEDFRSFLRGLAARGTSLDLVSALKGLNYEQMLMLLHGDWASLAAGGVNLSDFLTPPKRLWAVDCASGEILWRSE